MTTNYSDNESTQYNDPASEATEFEDTSSTDWNDEDLSQPAPAAAAAAAPAAKSSMKSTLKNAAIGGVTGVVIGGVAAVLMGLRSKPEDPTNQDETNTNNGGEEPVNPWVDDQIPVATTVTDDMSFNEAFAAAREEVGPGGAFEWHGGVYGTYTADEWNNLTAEQQAEYQDHFNWEHLDHSQSDLAQNGHASNDTASHEVVDNGGDDDIEVVSVDNPDHTGATEDPAAADMAMSEPEIEILGVVHDDESGANIGQLSVGDQDVIVVDVDGDLTFDYIATDVNGDGSITEDEISELPAQDLTVADLGGFTDPGMDGLAQTDSFADDSMTYEG